MHLHGGIAGEPDRFSGVLLHSVTDHAVDVVHEKQRIGRGAGGG
jgi:hypothetical protein